jgi:dTMP kinase
MRDDLAERLRGKFIVLDGPDGSGKSTQLALLADRLTAGGADVLPVRDPGGTDTGERIRAILLDRHGGDIAPACEMMLFMASRAQLVAEKVRPALAAGRVVLCDRFISATVAYQGAIGMDPRAIIEVGRVAVGGLWPDLTVVLNVPADVGLSRVNGRLGAGGSADRMESRDLDYHRRVVENFAALAEMYPAPAVEVSADGPAEAVFEKLLAVLEARFPHA